MRDLWTIMRLELRLKLRGRALTGLVVLGLVMAAFGIWNASIVHEYPIEIWQNMTVMVTLITLILAFTTGDQIHRDHVRRLDSVLLSTPISTQIYVWAKYLSALVILFGLSLINLLASIIMDPFYSWRTPSMILSSAYYPAMGPLPYIISWGLLVPVTMLFGAAVVLAGITLTRGQRIVAYTSILLLWLIPTIGTRVVPALLDVTGGSTQFIGSSPQLDTANALTQKLFMSGIFIPPAGVASQIVHLVQAAMVPPTFLSPIFFWNRLFFLALALLLILATVYGVGWQRRGRA